MASRTFASSITVAIASPGLRQDLQWEFRRFMVGFGGEVRPQDASFAYDRFERQLHAEGGAAVPVETNLNARAAPDGVTSGGLRDGESPAASLPHDRGRRRARRQSELHPRAAGQPATGRGRCRCRHV